MLLCCSTLYAEEKEEYKSYKVGTSIYISLDEYDYDLPDYDYKFIRAVLPYQDGYLLKLETKDRGINELFVKKGFSFYSCKRLIKEASFYKCEIIDIKPNEFTIQEQLLHTQFY